MPVPSLGDLPNPGIELRSLALQVDSSLFEPWGKHQGLEARSKVPLAVASFENKNVLRRQKLNTGTKFIFRDIA